ncbi:MAG: hypothetical protein J1F23_00995 [Oscillospiraceae bacterium]|nr:hypothetical protein [Oscillospiraceae bacterium]
MKRLLKFNITTVLSAVITVLFAVTAFAENGEIRYSNELTVSPLRIFFAVLVIIAFVALEIAVEKIREKRVKKRNGEIHRDK